MTDGPRQKLEARGPRQVRWEERLGLRGRLAQDAYRTACLRLGKTVCRGRKLVGVIQKQIRNICFRQRGNSGDPILDTTADEQLLLCKGAPEQLLRSDSKWESAEVAMSTEQVVGVVGRSRRGRLSSPSAQAKQETESGGHQGPPVTTGEKWRCKELSPCSGTVTTEEPEFPALQIYEQCLDRRTGEHRSLPELFTVS